METIPVPDIGFKKYQKQLGRIAVSEFHSDYQDVFEIRPIWMLVSPEGGFCTPGELHKSDIRKVMSDVEYPQFIRHFLRTDTKHDFQLDSCFVHQFKSPGDVFGLIITDGKRKLLDYCVSTSCSRKVERNRKIIRALIRAICGVSVN